MASVDDDHVPDCDEFEDGELGRLGDDESLEVPDEDAETCGICRVCEVAKKQGFCYKCLNDVKCAQKDAKAESKCALK